MNSKAYKIALISTMTATLSAGKLALSSIANIEVVSLLIMVYAFSFGIKLTVPSICIFVVIETMIYGFAPWCFSYFIYFPLLALTACLLKSFIKDKNTNKFILIPTYVLFIAFMTFAFGILTTAIDTLFYCKSSSYFEFFKYMYTSGIWFFVKHIVSNSIIIGIAFIPLLKAIKNFSYSNNLQEN